MAESELPYGIIAVVVLFIIILALSPLFLKTTKGLSKENFECKYLSLVPGFCTEADKQKIEEEKKQAQTNEVNLFIDKIADTFKTCGANSQSCKCSLEFSKLLNFPITIAKNPDGFIYIKSSSYEKKIECLTEISINNKQNKIVSLNSIYNTNFLLFNTKINPGITNLFPTTILQVLTGSPPQSIIDLGKPEDMNKLAIFKQDNKKGIYMPYQDLAVNSINIPNC